MHTPSDVVPIDAKAKQLNGELQDLVDEGCQTLIAQYSFEGGQVRPGAILNGDDGPPLTVPLNVGPADQFRALNLTRRYFDSSDLTSGVATIPVNFRGNEYIYVVARASGREAAALFVLDRRTGDAREDITLVTRMNLPVGGVGLTFASSVELARQEDDDPDLCPRVRQFNYDLTDMRAAVAMNAHTPLSSFQRPQAERSFK